MGFGIDLAVPGDEVGDRVDDIHADLDVGRRC